MTVYLHGEQRPRSSGDCTRAKSTTLTLSGLRKLNRQNNWMAKS